MVADMMSEVLTVVSTARHALIHLTSMSVAVSSLGRISSDNRVADISEVQAGPLHFRLPDHSPLCGSSPSHPSPPQELPPGA